MRIYLLRTPPAYGTVLHYVVLYKVTLRGMYRDIEKNKWPLLRIYQRKQ